MALRSIAPSTHQLRLLLVVAIALYLFSYLFNIADWTPSSHNSCILEYSSNTVEHRSSRLEYRFTNPSAQPVPGKQNVLVLTLVRDHKSWGQGRRVSDFMNIVQGFDYPLANINLGILASDKKEFNAIIKHIKQIPGDMTHFFPNIRVILREKDSGISRENRKDENSQRDRRRLIARLRNYLLYSTLQDEDSVLWIDSDMVMVPKNLLQRMIDSGKDVLTTATRMGPNGGFMDFNAWVGERITPNAEEQAVIERGGIFVPYPKNVKYTHELDEEFGELDSVGGTVLFVRGEVHREGVAFTTNYVIGAGWKYEGYDGIESEGLCYVAGFLGYKCWGMPYDIAEHSED